MTNSNQNRNIKISFGALSPPIGEQLRDQGFKLDLTPLSRELLQQDNDQVTRLFIRGILTESETSKARKRIFKIISKQAKPLQS